MVITSIRPLDRWARTTQPISPARREVRGGHGQPTAPSYSPTRPTDYRDRHLPRRRSQSPALRLAKDPFDGPPESGGRPADQMLPAPIDAPDRTTLRGCTPGPGQWEEALLPIRPACAATAPT